MKEKIYTIRINESFEKRCGCPVCRLREKTRADALEYITGAAMMEPDVRIETNRLGFCREHYDDLLKMKNRLSLALMLESRMDEVASLCFGRKDPPDGSLADKNAAKTVSTCFICKRIDTFMTRCAQNIAYMWKSEPEFERLFAEQEGLCLPCLALLLEAGRKELSKKQYAAFSRAAAILSKKMHDALRADLAGFTRSFDYRFAGEEFPERVKNAPANAAAYLSGGKK